MKRPAEGTGIGITTYNRPARLALCLPSIVKHLIGCIERLYVYNDGSDVEYGETVAALKSKIGALWDRKVVYHEADVNRGVGLAKNWLLKQMMDDGCEFLFLAEDDQVVLSPQAAGVYIDAHRSFTRCQHMMFAHHGRENRGATAHRITPRIEVYPNCVGAWCFYTRAVIEEVGYMDEFFRNAWEHVEHTHRIQKAGMLGIAPGVWGHFPDAVGSHSHIREIPGAVEDSTIRQDAAWRARMLEGLRYWKAKDPEAFPLDYLIRRWTAR